MSSEAELKEAIMKVHDYIAEKGWCQGTLEDSKGRVCLANATYILSDGAYKELFTPVREAITDFIKRPDITGYNDTAGRTKEEVLEMLKQVASKSYSKEWIKSAKYG